MTFDEYISNPAGKGAAVVVNKLAYQEQYSKKWDELKVRENGVVAYTLYKSANKEEYYCHFKIPDEVVPKFYYDIVFQFTIPSGKGEVGMERSLKNYEVRFFSNDPGFVYTYAYAFKSHHLMIKDLERKMSKLALKQKAVVRNPQNLVGYVKTIYFGYLEMKHLDLFEKSRWEGAKSYSSAVWSSTVTHADDKLADRKAKADAIAKKNKREKAAAKNAESGKSVSRSSFINEPPQSPNPKNFGHFKDGRNSFGKIVKNENKGFGHFKKGNLFGKH